KETFTVSLSDGAFLDQIAPARTFGFLHEAEAMRRQGLIRGASESNAVVLTRDGVLNPPLRFRDEFVRHKVLDLIGDLALLGRQITGHVIARNAGHALNFELVVAIQRVLGLERRAAIRTVPAPAAEPAEALVRARGLALS